MNNCIWVDACTLSGKGAYIKGGKKGGEGMNTHGEGGDGGGDGGQGDQQQGGPGGERVAKKNPQWE